VHGEALKEAIAISEPESGRLPRLACNPPIKV